MTEEEEILDSLLKQVQEIDEQYRIYFEMVLELDYAKSAKALDSMSLDLVKMATSPSTFVPDIVDLHTQRMIDELNERSKRSKTKKRLLSSILLGRVVLRNVIPLAEGGKVPKAIGALAAAAMVRGEISALNSEITAKAAPGKTTAAKRKADYEKREAEALARWKQELSPDLSAVAAAEKLRSMGVSLSLDKLMRLISANKKKLVANGESPRSKAQVVSIKSAH